MLGQLTALLISVLLNPGAAGQPVLSSSGGEVKATLVGGCFILEASINDSPVRLIVDTGASTNVLSPEAAKRLRIRGGRATSVAGVGSQRADARLVKLKHIRVGEAVVANDFAFVMEIPGAFQCDGIIGYSFLRHFVCRFDYQAGTITFIDPEQFEEPDGATKSKLRLESNVPMVPGSIDGFTGWLQLDTGACGGLATTALFMEGSQLSERYPRSEARVVGKGVGGFVKGRAARLDNVALGGQNLSEVPTVVTPTNETHGVPDILANVGAELLSRFTLTLDYSRSAAYFEKNASFDRPYRFDRAGIWLDLQGQKFVVVDVVPGSPAADTGMLVDDEIVSINGVRLSEVLPLEAPLPFQAPPGTKVKVSLRRKGTVIETELTLRDF